MSPYLQVYAWNSREKNIYLTRQHLKKYKGGLEESSYISLSPSFDSSSTESKHPG